MTEKLLNVIVCSRLAFTGLCLMGERPLLPTPSFYHHFCGRTYAPCYLFAVKTAVTPPRYAILPQNFTVFGDDMEIPMTAIEMTGTVDEDSQLILDGTLPFAGPKRVRVIVLSTLDDEIDELNWLQAASRNPAFAFLANPEEDIYTLTDGRPFIDEI
ncbi:MAG: hypothetical protein R6X34_28785 [Chloroflexota bacterium]